VQHIAEYNSCVLLRSACRCRRASARDRGLSKISRASPKVWSAPMTSGPGRFSDTRMDLASAKAMAIASGPAAAMDCFAIYSSRSGSIASNSIPAFLRIAFRIELVEARIIANVMGPGSGDKWSVRRLVLPVELWIICKIIDWLIFV
jgi:hypothetical protein